jgi:hypothetical protein
MTEARWGNGLESPAIAWHMSAALEIVRRGDGDMAEVTSLEQAVAAWLDLDPQHRSDAMLTPERPVLIDGVAHVRFVGDGISALAALLPTSGGRK